VPAVHTICNMVQLHVKLVYKVNSVFLKIPLAEVVNLDGFKIRLDNQSAKSVLLVNIVGKM
jgi:hypothetical protein